jgi:hypothetical protein
MNGDYCDALVVFGISGDLAFKKIFGAGARTRAGTLRSSSVWAAARARIDFIIERMRQPSRNTATAPTGRAAPPRSEAALRHGDYAKTRRLLQLRRSAARAACTPRHPAEPVHHGGGKQRLGLRQCTCRLESR